MARKQSTPESQIRAKVDSPDVTVVIVEIAVSDSSEMAAGTVVIEAEDDAVEEAEEVGEAEVEEATEVGVAARR